MPRYNREKATAAMNIPDASATADAPPARRHRSGMTDPTASAVCPEGNDWYPQPKENGTNGPPVMGLGRPTAIFTTRHKSAETSTCAAA